MSDVQDDQTTKRFVQASEAANLLPLDFRPELNGEKVEMSLTDYEVLMGRLGGLQRSLLAANRNHRALSHASGSFQTENVKLKALLRDHGIEIPA